jgi:mono/diheme cytochrome c family protein
MRVLAIAAAILMVGATTARAADARMGATLARQWCANCHVIGGATRGQDTAPPFDAIAAKHAGDRAWLRAWLTNPHPPMPDFHLSREEIDDLIAYLETLAPK